VLIDCDTCVARGIGCSDCVITVLLNTPRPVELDDATEAAFVTLADAGLVPPLRLVSGDCDTFRSSA
jgi:hypothetical protein